MKRNVYEHSDGSSLRAARVVVEHILILDVSSGLFKAPESARSTTRRSERALQLPSQPHSHTFDLADCETLSVDRVCLFMDKSQSTA